MLSVFTAPNGNSIAVLNYAHLTGTAEALIVSVQPQGSRYVLGPKPLDTVKLVQARGPLPRLHPRAVAAKLAQRYNLKDMSPEELRALARLHCN